jgi:hypothetical protein
MNDVERALLKACHYALIMMRDRAYTKSVTPEEVAGVTDALELVIIELWSGRAPGNHLLLEGVLADISRKFEGYGAARRSSRWIRPVNSRGSAPSSSRCSPTPSDRCPPGRGSASSRPARSNLSGIESSMSRF